MGTNGLPDIYTQSTRATGLRAEGVYIRQTMSAHGIIRVWASAKQLKPDRQWHACTYIATYHIQFWALIVASNACFVILKVIIIAAIE